MKPPNIDLHIDRLVLDGFGPMDRTQLGAAVEAELGRLLAERDPASLGGGGYIPHVDGGSFQAVPGAGAEAIGRQIAQAVYGGIQR